MGLVCLIHCLTVVSYIQVRFNKGPISFSSFITILHQVVFGLPLFPFNWSPFIADDWASVLWAFNILYIFNVTVYFNRNEMFSPFFTSRLYWVEKILNMLNQRKAEHLRHLQSRNLKLLMWKSYPRLKRLVALMVGVSLHLSVIFLVKFIDRLP